MKDDIDTKRDLLRFLNGGVEFTAPIVVCVLLGLWLDKKFNLFPMFLVILLIIGCIAGYFNMKRYLNL
ncbi:MAG: AtpZ/AtpI family protein [Alphaproteobacteria bacterium]|nr:AtpZ/AtpI family protein [Alphaproteobacteria bacterium]